MDHRQFLDVLAAGLPGKPSAARTTALRQFAPKLMLDVPASRLSRDLADAVARDFDDFPTYDALIRAIRTSPILGTEGTSAPAEQPRQGEVGAYLDVFAQRVAAGIDMAKLLTIAARHYPTEAWQAIRARYIDDVRRVAPQLDPEPVPPEERARRFAAYRAQTVLAAAPPPPGPAVTTRPVMAPERPLGAVSPDTLALLRERARVGA